MSISRGSWAVAASLVFAGGCASAPAGPAQTASSGAPRMSAAAADKATQPAASSDKTAGTAAAPVRARHAAPGCDGDTFALIGSAHSRSEPHWVDCRTGDRVEYSDAEFDTWFAARHAARAPSADAR